jgi:hypothetical protein
MRAGFLRSVNARCGYFEATPMFDTQNSNNAQGKRTSHQPLVNNASLDSRFIAIKDHLYSELMDEAVILSMRNGKYYGLSGVGASIWRALRSPSTFGEIKSSVMDEYEVGEDTCQREVLAFLQKLMDEGLVDVLDEPAT